MPAKKKRNSKPKSVNKKTITIHQSSPTFQSQETTSRPPLNLSGHQQERNRKTNSAMEDNSSSNGIVAEQEYKEVAVEDVGDSKTDPGEGSILDKIVAVAEEVLHGDGSSSSSSSDDEGEQPEPKAAEDKVESSPAVDDVPSNVENFVSIVEAKLESVVSDHDEAKDSSASAVSPFSEVKIAEAEEVVSKVVEENACVVVSSEPPSENVDDVHIDQIPETAANPVAPGVCVTRDSLQAASWKSCCGLFEVLRRSER